ncbi:hypothetical protein Tco_1374956 [Tanacetum coccineum]
MANTYRESDEEHLDQSMKIKVIKMLSAAAQFNSSSSSLEFDDEIKDISSDDERSEADDMQKIKKSEDDKAAEEKFLNDNPDVSLTYALKNPWNLKKTKVLLKKSKKPEAQADTGVILKRLTKLETKVEAMSKFNLLEAIE